MEGPPGKFVAAPCAGAVGPAAAAPRGTTCAVGKGERALLAGSRLFCAAQRGPRPRKPPQAAAAGFVAPTAAAPRKSTPFQRGSSCLPRHAAATAVRSRRGTCSTRCAVAPVGGGRWRCRSALPPSAGATHGGAGAADRVLRRVAAAAAAVFDVALAGGLAAAAARHALVAPGRRRRYGQGTGRRRC